tara:strand:+ start:14827 stop:15504 length:678 start_codon:yes stop_codon:yes gene_type:complete
MKILLIEDDEQAALSLLKGLTESGHTAVHKADGKSGLLLAQTEKFDVLIVDRMLPKLDGLSLIQKLRSEGEITPALILSALGEVDDRVDGLRSGGDDYLVKPYAFSELLARVEVLSKRNVQALIKDQLRVGNLELDLMTHRVKRDNTLIRLQPRELRLLEYFMRHVDQVVTRTMLLEQIWGIHFDPETNVIDTQVSRLRSKIDKHFDQPLLHTIRGKGYLLSEHQ